MTRCVGRRNEGAGSILVITVMTVIVLLGGSVMVLLVAMTRHERVQAAADTAAAAAVGAALVGVVDPCGFAARGVEAQGLRQLRCTVIGDEVEVVVDEPAASPLFSRQAFARAGLVNDDAPRDS